MITSKKRISTSPTRSTKNAARPERMRSYRIASALPIGGLRLSEGVNKAVGLVTAKRENGLRIQRQWIISFVAVIAMLALLAGLYLNVTASASIAGRQIQNLEIEITANEQFNADLKTRIAGLLANSVLESRAKALGFQPVERTSLQYMVVPGYFPPRAASMVPAATPVKSISDLPEFDQTLFEWISEQIQAASIPLSESNR
jgi:cell division protein FtsL